MKRREILARQIDPITRYLWCLRWWLPKQCRAEVIAEVRRHLYDSAQLAERAGLSPLAAQRHAIKVFGSARQLGLAMRQTYQRPTPRFPGRARGITAHHRVRLPRWRQRRERFPYSFVHGRCVQLFHRKGK